MSLPPHACPPRIVRSGLTCFASHIRHAGTGTSNGEHDAAAVCIFESYTPERSRENLPQDVNGIARMVQVGDTTLLDLTIKHDGLDLPRSTEGAFKKDESSQLSSSSSSSSLPFASYGVYIARTGNISQGAASTGGVLRELGKVEMRRSDGYGDLFTEFKGLNIWEVIGRAMVIAPILASEEQKQDNASLPPSSQQQAAQATTQQRQASSSSSSGSESNGLAAKQGALRLGPGILAGVIARSAGAWSESP